MNVELKSENENSDHSGPVLDIYFDKKDAFDFGILFQQLKNIKACVWRADNHIRIPLVMMDEIGLAITYKKGNNK